MSNGQEALLKNFADALSALVATSDMGDGLYRQSVIFRKTGALLDIQLFDVEEILDGGTTEGASNLIVT